MSGHEIDILKKRIAELEKLEAGQKQAEAELRFHGEIMRNMAEGVYLVGADSGIIRYCNLKFEKMFGYETGEMIGKHVSIVNAPAERDPKETAKEIAGILDKTGEWHGEVHNIKKDGTTFWCYANVSAFNHYEYGKVWVAVHRDITEKKKAEDELKISEHNFKQIFNTANDGLILADGGTKKIFICNKAICKMTGYTEDEFLRLGVKDLHPEKDLPYVIKGFEALMREDTILVEALPTKRKDGSVFLADVVGTKVNFGGKEYLMGSFRDITERKKAEEEIKKDKEELAALNDKLLLKMNDIQEKDQRLFDVNEKLKQSAEEWEKTFDSISDLIFIQNTDHTILKVNKAFAAALKMLPRDIIGKKCYELLHRMNSPWPDCPHERMKKDKATHTQEVDDANIGIPLLVTTSPVFNDRGEVIGSVHIAKDITVLKEREKELAKKIHDLEVFHKAAVGRELRIEELKKRVKELEARGT